MANKLTKFVKTFEQFRNDMLDDHENIDNDNIDTDTENISDKLDMFLESNGYYSQWHDNDLQDRSTFLKELSNRLNSDPFAIGLWLYQDCNIYPDFQLLQFLHNIK